MDDQKYIRACKNGHIINIFDNPKDTSSAFSDIISPSMSLAGPNYCQECGAETIITCPNSECDSSIGIRTDSNQDTLGLKELTPEIQSVKKDDLPSYCATCGTAYPWITPIEEETVREGEFLSLKPNEVEGHFYQQIVSEINTCYRVKSNNATSILYRKLLENLIYDILLARYGPEEMELYFNKDAGVRLGLKSLVESLKTKRSDLKQFSQAIDDPQTIQLIQEFKQDGDSSAHTKENLILDAEIEKKSEDATKVAKILFGLRKSVYAISE